MALSCVAAACGRSGIWRQSRRRETSRTSSNVSRNDSIVRLSVRNVTTPNMPCYGNSLRKIFSGTVQ